MSTTWQILEDAKHLPDTHGYDERSTWERVMGRSPETPVEHLQESLVRLWAQQKSDGRRLSLDREAVATTEQRIEDRTWVISQVEEAIRTLGGEELL